jgi:hypothetical protein
MRLLVPALLTVTLFYIHRVIAGETAGTSDRAEAGEKTTRARTANKPTSSQPQPNNYAVIARRNLFRPLIAPKVRQEPLKPLPMPLSPPPMSPPPSPPTPPPAETHNVAEVRIAVVGAVQVGSEWYALVEDLTTGEARFVREGESAFGYNVKAVGADNAVLERDGQTLTVTMGENKVAAPIHSAAGTERTSDGGI